MEFLINLFFYLEYIFWFVLVFTIIVFVHEFGHYYVAVLNGVKVERFSIGFGPPLIKYTDKKDTTWQLCTFPLGGYVKFEGEMYPDKSKTNKNSKLFMHKTAFQKASVVLAGPLANFILGILLFIFIFVIFGKNYTAPIVGKVIQESPAEYSGLIKNDRILALNKKNIFSFEEIYSYLDSELYEQINFTIIRGKNVKEINIKPEKKLIKTFINSSREINYIGIEPLLTPIINKVVKKSPAHEGGMKTKDKIVQINNIKVNDISQVVSIIKKNPNNILNFLVLRDKKTVELNIYPNLVINKKGEKKGVIGITFLKERKKIDFFTALIDSIKNFFLICYKTLIAFGEIIFGKRDHCEVGGPILIAKVSNDIGSQDIVSFASLIALISINLGLINLFPLPLLDGGHFFTYIYEGIYKKKVTLSFFKYFQSIGIVLIFSLMIFSIFNDIYCRVLN